MSNRTNLIPMDPLISFWRGVASVLCARQVLSETKSAKGTESIGAGAEEVAVLWHKASKSDLMSSLHKAALEILKHGEKIMAAVARMYGMAKAMLLWTEHWIPSEPHEELIPWVAWFRPISARNYVWEYTWPEEEYLHP